MLLLEEVIVVQLFFRREYDYEYVSRMEAVFVCSGFAAGFSRDGDCSADIAGQAYQRQRPRDWFCRVGARRADLQGFLARGYRGFSPAPAVPGDSVFRVTGVSSIRPVYHQIPWLRPGHGSRVLPVGGRANTPRRRSARSGSSPPNSQGDKKFPSPKPQ